MLLKIGKVGMPDRVSSQRFHRYELLRHHAKHCGDHAYCRFLRIRLKREEQSYNYSDAHQALKKTCHKVSSQFFWTRMKKHVKKWVSSCKICGAKKLPVTKYKVPLHPITGAERPFDIIVMDFIGPLPDSLFFGKNYE